MGKLVKYEVRGGVAVLTIDNPPVNALGAALRRKLMRRVARAEGDESVRAIVIRAAGRTFPVGADVREFGQPPKEPLLPELCNRIEAAEKPVVVAIHGTALGGGLEIALAGHYRIADAPARLGLPEVLLGILPGAGGTQRTPRLTGAGPALEMMLSGRPVSAQRALEIGLIDRIAEGDLAEEAIAWARELGEAAEAGAAPRRSRDQRAGLADPDAYLRAIAERRKALQGSRLPAPPRIVDCVEAALLVPFETGLAMERAAFEECLASDEAAALRHAFFAERLVAKVPELVRAEPREVGRVGVVGAGLMGAGIATVCLAAGLEVTLVERDEAALAAGLERIEKLHARAVEKGRARPEQVAERMARLRPVTDMAALAEADLAIEAVFEDEQAKRAVFAALDRVLRPGAILATNTSYLDIDALAAATSRPEDVIGLHFFSPAHVMKLVEVVVGARSDEAVTATAFALARRLGKVPVRAGVCDGFIGNRILTAYRQVADFMLEDGASPYEIDAAMRDYGFALGPYQVADMAGLDIAWARRKRLAASRDPAERYVRIADLLCEAGRFGQKTGAGYYRYEAGSRHGAPDPEVLALIDAERAERGIRPRPFAPEEIQRRCLEAMINEGARILGEGIALRPADIDVVMLLGYGFPRWRGGPMFEADRIGLLPLHAELARRAREEGDFWRPAPLLEELLADGRRLRDLNG